MAHKQKEKITIILKICYVLSEKKKQLFKNIITYKIKF